MRMLMNRAIQRNWQVPGSTDGPKGTHLEARRPSPALEYVKAGVWLLLVLLPGACQQQMAKQPAYRPLEPSSFFADGRSARPPVVGTVARGQLSSAVPPNTGIAEHRQGSAVAVAALTGVANAQPIVLEGMLVPTIQKIALDEYSSKLPIPVTADLLERGRQRFFIFCVVCHDPAGNGNGKIVQRGFTHPPSLITDRSRGFERRGISVLLRDVPVDYYFDVISKGYGAMSGYAALVPPHDRWAIIAYVRALQWSQYAPLRAIPSEESRLIRESLEGGK